MLVYRAQLSERVAAVAAVSARLCPRGRLLGGGDGPVPVRVTLRYVLPSGEIRTHRGRLYARLEAGCRIECAGYQVCGTEVSLFLEPRRRRPAGGAVAVTDQFALPFGLSAWGVTRVDAVEAVAHASCHAVGEALEVRGTVLVVLRTPATPLRLRIPFCRVLKATRPIDPALRWQAQGGVTGTPVTVGDGGRIEGEVQLQFRLVGRPVADAPQLPPLKWVREVRGQVTAVRAELLGSGQVLVEGTAAIDLYWIDDTGASRWTGRQAPFNAVLPAPGVADGDAFEATADLERITHRIASGVVSAHLVVGVTVTALRPTLVGAYRLSQQVAVLHGNAEADAPLLGSNVERPTGCLTLQSAGWTVEGTADLPGPFRRVLSVALLGGRGQPLQIEALVQPETGGLRRVEAPVRLEEAHLPGRPLQVTAMPELDGAQYRLRLFIACAAWQTAGDCGDI